MAPIVVFTYKKLAPLKQAIETLSKNSLASESEIIVFSDGPSNENDLSQIEAVRAYLKQIDGFKSVTINEADENRGLAKSIIDGVTEVFKDYDAIIVLEDDLITSPNFLDFMNQALQNFKDDQRMHSVSGYTVPIELPQNYGFDNYFTRRASSWGWATWKDRWESVDWQVTDYDTFKNDRTAKKKFNQMGSDMFGMLAKQMNGKISSWAIRWCYDQFKKNQLTVFPIISKVSNVGFGEDATHTKGNGNRFATPLDTSGKKRFDFNLKPEMDIRFLKQFTAKYSLWTRAHYKFKNLLGI